ncbi:MAG: tetratricopeptide repeat protein [Proteobacteria bacterium]|nr:tetratricopeptide repeat protein [Pseudomonadota bacterium]
MMKKLFAALAIAAIAGFTLPAQAGQCPVDMKKIDAAISSSSLDADQMSLVKTLRAQGEVYHKAGQHKESVEALAKAKAILRVGGWTRI